VWRDIGSSRRTRSSNSGAISIRLIAPPSRW
jgi:hypothetical protein